MAKATNTFRNREWARARRDGNEPDPKRNTHLKHSMDSTFERRGDEDFRMQIGVVSRRTVEMSFFRKLQSFPIRFSFVMEHTVWQSGWNNSPSNFLSHCPPFAAPSYVLVRFLCPHCSLHPFDCTHRSNGCNVVFSCIQETSDDLAMRKLCYEPKREKTRPRERGINSLGLVHCSFRIADTK